MTSIPIRRFDETYAADPDPWGFASRWYEARKYALTLAALPERRYRRGFEPGCSIGVLTAQLADRCEYLLSADGAESAVEHARKRLTGRDHVEVRKMVLPHEWPAGRWDLVLLSELGYYFDDDDLALLLERAAATMEPGATLLAVHWLGPTDYPLTGDAVHEKIGRHRAFQRQGGYREASFRMDLFLRGRS